MQLRSRRPGAGQGVCWWQHPSVRALSRKRGRSMQLQPRHRGLMLIHQGNDAMSMLKGMLRMLSLITQFTAS
eukprot:366031-Chlamydomonas_euryale.AAC.21